MLPDWMIRDLVKAGRLGIDPYDEGRLQPASYDLALGRELLFPAPGSAVDPEQTKKIPHAPWQLSRPDQVPFQLLPQRFILAHTVETITLPADIAARIEGKSSLGRLGLLCHVTAGFIDPGWSGQLTLELYNLLDVPIVLRAGMPIAQISFYQMAGTAEKPYQGRYVDSVGVVPSRYGRDP